MTSLTRFRVVESFVLVMDTLLSIDMERGSIRSNTLLHLMFRSLNRNAGDPKALHTSLARWSAASLWV